MAAVDVGTVVSEVTAQMGAVAAVGVAVLALYVVSKSFGWLKKVLLSTDGDAENFSELYAATDEPVHPDEDERYADVDYDEKSPGDEGYDEYDAKRAFWR